MVVVVVEGVLKTVDKRAPEAQQSTTGSNSEVDDVNSSRFEEGCFSVFWTGSCFQYNVRVSKLLWTRISNICWNRNGRVSKV